MSPAPPLWDNYTDAEALEDQFDNYWGEWEDEGEEELDEDEAESEWGRSDSVPLGYRGWPDCFDSDEESSTSGYSPRSQLPESCSPQVDGLPEESVQVPANPSEEASAVAEPGDNPASDLLPDQAHAGPAEDRPQLHQPECLAAQCEPMPQASFIDGLLVPAAVKSVSGRLPMLDNVHCSEPDAGLLPAGLNIVEYLEVKDLAAGSPLHSARMLRGLRGNSSILQSHSSSIEGKSVVALEGHNDTDQHVWPGGNLCSMAACSKGTPAVT